MVFGQVFNAVTFGIKFSMVFGSVAAATAYMSKPRDESFEEYIRKVRSFVLQTKKNKPTESESFLQNPLKKLALSRREALAPAPTPPESGGSDDGDDAWAKALKVSEDVLRGFEDVGDIDPSHYTWFIQDCILAKIVIVRPITSSEKKDKDKDKDKDGKGIIKSEGERHHFIGVFNTWLPCASLFA